VDEIGILIPLFGILIVAGTCSYLAFTAVQVVRRRLLGEGLPAIEEIVELRNRVEELEDQGTGGLDQGALDRVAELEERLDFAERLLAQGDLKALPVEPTDEVTTQ
jgi:hypothetical protein